MPWRTQNVDHFPPTLWKHKNISSYVLDYCKNKWYVLGKDKSWIQKTWVWFPALSRTSHENLGNQTLASSSVIWAYSAAQLTHWETAVLPEKSHRHWRHNYYWFVYPRPYRAVNAGRSQELFMAKTDTSIPPLVFWESLSGLWRDGTVLYLPRDSILKYCTDTVFKFLYLYILGTFS